MKSAGLTTAFNVVREELDELKAGIAPNAPSEVRAFLDLHRLILGDALLADAPRDLIRGRLINAEWALTIQLEQLVKQFDAIDDEYLRERSTDVRQVVERVVNALAGGRPTRVAFTKQLAPGERLILIAQDLAPADVLHLKDRADVDLAGFVTELGGPTSHTAILARSLGLPAVVGAENARSVIEEGDLVVIDADFDAVIVNPSDEELAEFGKRVRDESEHRVQLRKLKGKIARTRDGIAIELQANIELPEDARDALEAGADGIGLFRSEFLFMDRDELPTEDEQYEAYAKVARAMKGKPVVIRTLDIGADKVLNEAARETLGNGTRRPAPGVEPCARLARDPLLPGLSRIVFDAAARDPASVGSRHRSHLGADAGAYARSRAGARLCCAGEAATAREKAQVRRPRANRRHGRSARRGAFSAAIGEEAEVPVDRHQRSDSVHACDRSCGFERCAFVRSPASCSAAADCVHDQGMQKGQGAGVDLR